MDDDYLYLDEDLASIEESMEIENIYKERKHFKKFSQAIDNFISLIMNLDLKYKFKISIVKTFKLNPNKGNFTKLKKLEVSFVDIKSIPFSMNSTLEFFYNLLDKKNFNFGIDIEVKQEYRQYLKGEKVEKFSLYCVEKCAKKVVNLSSQKHSIFIFEEECISENDLLNKLNRFSDFIGKQYIHDYEFFVCLYSKGTLQFSSKKNNEYFLKDISNKLIKQHIPFRFYIYEERNNPLNFSINRCNSSIIFIDKHGLFHSILDFSLNKNFQKELELTLDSILNNSTRNDSNPIKYIDEQTYHRLKRIISNFSYIDDSSLNCLNFLLHNLLNIEAVFKKSLQIDNYKEVDGIQYEKPEIIFSNNNDNQIHHNIFISYLLQQDVMNGFTINQKYINDLSSNKILRNYYNRVNSFGVFLPIKNFILKVKENFYKTGESRTIKYIDMKNVKDPFSLVQIGKLNEISDIRLKPDVTGLIFNLLSSKDELIIEGYLVLVILILEYRDFSPLDMLIKTFKIHNKWNAEVKVLIFVDSQISSDLETKLTSSDFSKHCIVNEIISKVHFYEYLLGSENKIFILGKERNILYKGNQLVTDIQSLFKTLTLLKSNEIILKLKKEKKKQDLIMSSKFYNYLSNIVYDSVLKNIKYNYNFNFEKKIRFKIDLEFNQSIEKIKTILYFRARKKEITSLQSLISEFMNKEKISSYENLIDLILDPIETISLKIGSQCNICLTKINEKEFHYYCYWCNFYFCVECANTFQENKIGTEKLIHPHNLVYLSSSNYEFLHDIDQYKLGYNIVSNHYPTSINQNHLAHCDCCYIAINNSPRFICLNCRPGEITYGGYRDYCEDCIRILTNPSHNQHQIYKNKCMMKDHHDVSHNYLRVFYSSGNYQGF